MTKPMSLFLALVFTVGLPSFLSAGPRPWLDKDDRKQLHKLMKEEDKQRRNEIKELRKMSLHRAHHRRHMRVVALRRPVVFVPDNFGRRRSALAHRQNAERRALHFRQMEERRVARLQFLNRRTLAMRQNDERRLLQQRQRLERRAIRP